MIVHSSSIGVLLIIAYLLFALFIVRTLVTASIVTKLINEKYSENMRRIHSGESVYLLPNINVDATWTMIERDLRKWTFKQCFPDGIVRGSYVEG
jgi:hypothetical protein